MLAKKYRLPIQTVLKQKSGHSFKSRYFLFKIFSSDLPFSRFGLIVSKKISKKAVDRNRIKRLVFNYLRKNISLNRKNSKSDDVLIITMKNIPEKEKLEAIEDLSSMFNN
ncbi:MAG: ribonuclease P protein component [Candidatus Pacebacteria bacterium]|nr:ribonuclease P protein component [Candidatus Paceibacterota bacterium]